LERAYTAAVLSSVSAAARFKPLRRVAPRVGVIGSLCSSDLVLTDALRRANIAADSLRHRSESSTDVHSGLFPSLSDEHVITFESPEALLRRLRRYDVIFSFTASLGFHLDRLMYAYPLLRRLGWPPYVNISTGADITERALDGSRAGMLQRFTMRHAFAQAVPPYPDAIRTAARMRLTNACVLPAVQITIADGEPDPPSGEWRFRTRADELLLLHPSNLDWGVTDPGPRASTKGNDRFLRALALVRGDLGRPVTVIMLERGPDRDLAKELVRELGLDKCVRWRQHLSRPDLFAAMREADLIVDQFDIGALGMIAWEAFNAGRPVLSYVQENSELLAYDVNSPVFNAHTVDEIAARLRDAADPELLRERTERARGWARERSMDALLPRYLFYATLASGREATDFGWDRAYGHQWSRGGD
jgi:hypothetical protein